MSEPEKLDERALRREDFVPGSPVVLADGQEWELRCPLLRFSRDNSHPSGFMVRLTMAGVDRFAELMERRKKVIEAEADLKVSDIVGIELEVAELLLTANYDLTPEQAADLLLFSYDDEADPEGCAIRDGCMDVAEGRGKKASPATRE
jgi:hypothetical protein